GYNCLSLNVPACYHAYKDFRQFTPWEPTFPTPQSPGVLPGLPRRKVLRSRRAAALALPRLSNPPEAVPYPGKRPIAHRGVSWRHSRAGTEWRGRNLFGDNLARRWFAPKPDRLAGCVLPYSPAHRLCLCLPNLAHKWQRAAFVQAQNRASAEECEYIC